MHPAQGWLSEDAHRLQQRLEKHQSPHGQPDATPAPAWDCDVLVVGSGYGGAVAAARLSGVQEADGQAQRVWVIERGREYLPGMFPSRVAELPGHLRISRQDGSRPAGNATALWDLRIGPDMTVVLGSGLGGGSLVNAAVMERPEPDIWQHGWPAGVDAQTLEPHVRTVLAQLQAAPLPRGLHPPKLAALQLLGDALPGRPEVERCAIAISFGTEPTPGAGVPRQACTLCGDCATGCNAQAKNSLDTNYLALARRRGAEVFCGALALRVRKLDGGWALDWSPTDDRLPWAAHTLPIRARRLLICAGSLGSTELLLHSRSAGLQLSPALGTRFSGNGDMIAAAVGLPFATRVCGDETTSATAAQPSRGIGPTITGMLRTGEGSRRFVIEEFAIPAPLRVALGELTGSLGLLQGLLRHDFSVHHPFHRGNEPLSPGAHAIDHTMVYGLMGDDGARGRLERKPAPEDSRDGPGGIARWDGQLAVHWPRARYETVYEAQHRALSAALSHATVGHYVPNPLWRPVPDALDGLVQVGGVRGPLTTVHPLGGCPMADNPEHGVVDRLGRVFDAGHEGTVPRVHEGLVVLDGAAMPRALGINPALTIAAWAEYAVAGLAAAWGLREPALPPARVPAFDTTKRPVWAGPLPRPRQPSTAVRIREQLHGTLELDGRRYWAELQVRFAPIEDVAALARSLPREVGLEHAQLRLYDDRHDRPDEPSWTAQRSVDPQPLFEVELSGHAKVLHRQWTTWPSRLWRTWQSLRDVDPGTSLPLWTKMAIASHLGERRVIDYLLHVDRSSSPACPLQPGELLHGRKVLACDRSANPWRQLSEMTLARRTGPGLFGPRYPAAGTVALDLRHFVQQRVTLLELLDMPDMVTALADLGAFGAFALRLMLKVQLLKFMPPRAAERPVNLRRPGPLPGLSLERHDLREHTAYGWASGPRAGQPLKALLTRYRSTVERCTSAPILLVHGLTASGSSYAHPSLPDNLVQSLCRDRRDVWVAELPTSIAFDKREAEDLSFEDVAEQIPVLVRYVRDRTGARQVDLLGHCIGAAMTVRALLRSESLGREVRAVVLSQVGPLIQMSPANQLRGYVASYLQRFLQTRTLDARPSSDPGPLRGLGQTLLDAVLASLPYPDSDREGEWAEQAVRAGRPDFRLVRHRSDAMLGQIFELSEHSAPTPAMLDALDDILGYARVQTLAQVIHYGRLEMLSDHDGSNREIRDELAAQRLPRRVLLLHGRRSGVFDWRGSLRSWEWLNSCLPGQPAPSANVERNDERLHLGPGSPRQLCVFDRFGHQDTIVGARAPAVVFPVIGRFLREADASADGPASTASAPAALHAHPAVAPRWQACVPEFGPVLGRLQPAGKRLRVAVLLHPSQRQAHVRFIALVPLRWAAGGWQRCGPARLRQFLGPLDGRGRPTADDPSYLGERLRAGAFWLTLDPPSPEDRHQAWLALTIHNDLSRAATRVHCDWREQHKQANRAIGRLLRRPRAEWEPALLQLPPQVLAAQDSPELPPRQLCLALASCQYPAGLLDQSLAGESYRRLAARLDGSTRSPGAGLPPPQLLLMVGDQVYVDETAGLFDPALGHTGFTEIYRRAFSLPGFRRVASRLPTLMIGDDHEVADNWQPGWTADTGPAWRAQAIFQGSLLTGQAVADQPPADASAQLHPGGFPLYLLDTRSRRERRSPSNAHRAAIVDEARMSHLLAWLDKQQRRDPDLPKLLVSPVVLLPLDRRLGAEPAWASDGWAGYPASRERLLRHIAEHRIRHVVLLSGDVHLSMAGEFELRLDGQAPAVRVFSVVSSGSYAPWRFANQQPHDFCVAAADAEGRDMPGPWVTLGEGGLQVRAVRTCCHTANGFAVLAFDRSAGRLQVELDLSGALLGMNFDLGASRAP